MVPSFNAEARQPSGRGLKNFIDLFLDSAPWLLLGLILAGLLKVFVPMVWMQKQLGGHGVKTVVKAAMLGAPLPLCSCGVIPAAVGLRRSEPLKQQRPRPGVDARNGRRFNRRFLRVTRPLYGDRQTDCSDYLSMACLM